MTIRKKALLIIAAGLMAAGLSGLQGSFTGGATGISLVAVGVALLISPTATATGEEES